MLCCWVEDPNSEAFKLHLPRIHDYLWLAEDGMKMQVCNFSSISMNIEMKFLSNVQPIRASLRGALVFLMFYVPVMSCET